MQLQLRCVCVAGWYYAYRLCGCTRMHAWMKVGGCHGTHAGDAIPVHVGYDFMYDLGFTDV